MNKCRLLRLAILAMVLVALLVPFYAVAQTQVPGPGQSKMIDGIKTRGTLRAAALGEFPWLPENTTGVGPRFSGPAWTLVNEYAKRLGVNLQIVDVSHDTKVPILTTGQADITIAPLGVTEERKRVIDFVVYTETTSCYFGLASNPKLANVKIPDDLQNREDLTIANFAGQPNVVFIRQRFPKMKTRDVVGSGANAPIEEITSGRADLTMIDAVMYPMINKQVPGLKFIPEGDDCLRSKEWVKPLGMGVPKGDPVYLEWLQAVADEMRAQLKSQEVQMVKEAAK